MKQDDARFRFLTKTELAFNRVREAIESGTLSPGDRLMPHKMATDMGMSPTPIREALRLLQAEGLVEGDPHRGLHVRQLKLESVTEMYALRIQLEPLAATWAVRRSTDEDIAAARQAHEEFLSAVSGHSPRGGALNLAFHAAICRPSRSLYLLDILERLWAAIPATGLWMTATADMSIEDHSRILQAFEARDEAGVASAVLDHLQHGIERDRGRLSGIDADIPRPTLGFGSRI